MADVGSESRGFKRNKLAKDYGRESGFESRLDDILVKLCDLLYLLAIPDPRRIKIILGFGKRPFGMIIVLRFRPYGRV